MAQSLTNDYIVEAENGFIGMQSRTNPLELQPGYLQLSQNMRLDRNTAAVRKGLKRMTPNDIAGAAIYASNTFLSLNGVEYILLASFDRLHVYNIQTQSIDDSVMYPTGRTITANDKCDLIQANNVLYILRGSGGDTNTITSIAFSSSLSPVSSTANITLNGHGFTTGDEVIVTGITSNPAGVYNGSFIINVTDVNNFNYTINSIPSVPAIQPNPIYCQKGKAPLVWDGAFTVTVTPQGSSSIASANMPCSDFGIYSTNRLIYKLKRDKIAASDYLSNDVWDLQFSQFTINLGANDYIVGFQDWQQNQFLIFQRNSIYYAYVDPNGYVAGAPPGGNTTIQTLTSEFGCSARRSIVQAGEFIFFLSDNGVYLLNPSLDLKLLGNTTPLSNPISDIMSRINVDYVSNAVGTIFNNRYYLAVPIDGSTRNNAVLIYSMLNKQWESIDNYPSGMYVDNFVVALYTTSPSTYTGAAKRLYAINQEKGIFLTEENNYDEFEFTTGTPTLPFTLPYTMTSGFTQYAIAGQLITRRYFYNNYSAKHFSSAEMDIICNANDALKVTAITTNPDSTKQVFNFASSTAQDYTKRFRIASRGFGLDLKIESTSGRPTVRGLRITSTVPGRNLISET
jgi:hypothetical protein